LKGFLTRWRLAGLVWPSVLSLVGLAVLVGLGTWQLARKAWKEELLAQIAARARATPVPLSEALRRWQENGDVEYLHVRVAGRFRHDREQHVFAVEDRLGPGFHVYTPLETPDGKYLALINRGFVPATIRDAAKRAGGQRQGEVVVTGLARRPSPRGWFVPASDPEHNVYFWPDYPNLLAGAREPGRGDPAPVPFFIDADAEPANPGGLPKGGVTRLALPNRHLEYALTWYGLALTLAGVFAAFALSRLQRR
jgi:surfeit locus 1 family protein